jgi:hypothetical protein
VLQALAARFDDERVKIDQKVANPARIWKLYGTVAAKGDHTADRPHRVSRLLEVPAEATAVSHKLLEKVAPRETCHLNFVQNSGGHTRLQRVGPDEFCSKYGGLHSGTSR